MNQRESASSTGSVVYGPPAVFHEPDRPGLPLISVKLRGERCEYLSQKDDAYAWRDCAELLSWRIRRSKCHPVKPNARLVANAERYYRIMYYGSRASWNLRDNHMFETLKNLLAFHGPDSRAVVWAHNSHIGNAQATEMAARGEHNLGQLCRKEYGE